jgi:DNA-binding MarR family transcriptional regulator
MTQEKILDLAGRLEQTLRRVRIAKTTADGADGPRPAEKFLLGLIDRLGREGGATPGALAEAACVSQAAVTHQLNAMETGGYIARRVSPQDRRVILVHLTPEGQRLADHQREMLLGMVAYLGEDEVEQLIRLMDRVGAYIEQQHSTRKE